MTGHQLDLQHQLDAGGERTFRCVCSCGWTSVWYPTNAVMGRGRRHLAAMRRRAAE